MKCKKAVDMEVFHYLFEILGKDFLISQVP